MSMKKKRIMILGASILQKPAIVKAKEMGLDVVAIDIDEHAVGFEIADICLPISTVDIPNVVKAARRFNVDGIMTLCTDIPMPTVAAVAKECGLVGIDMDTAIRATNKAEMRQCLKEHRVPIPNFYRVRIQEEYTAAIRCYSEKCIVKPADNSGSRGVYLIKDVKNQEQVNEAYRYSKAFSRSGDVVVEDFMEGPEVSVETLSVDGEVHIIQITDKLTTDAPYFVEIGHSQPSLLSENEKIDICHVATAAVRAIGITNGPSHTEIKLTKSGAKIVELGARLGGDCITTHLVPFSTGVDMVKCCIEIAMGEKPDFKQKLNCGSAIRYIPSHKGVMDDITGVEEAKKIAGICEIVFVKQLGDEINDIHNSTDRVGFVIAQGDNAISAVTLCEQATSMIDIKVRK